MQSFSEYVNTRAISRPLSLFWKRERYLFPVQVALNFQGILTKIDEGFLVACDRSRVDVVVYFLTRTSNISTDVKNRAFRDACSTGHLGVPPSFST